MPEPGITDRNFNRPTTDREKPRRRRPGGKRLRKPIKLPREYADFQLEEGRQAVEVLGESFFEPEAGKGASRTDRGQTRPGAIDFGGTVGGGSPISALSTAAAGANPIRAQGYAETRGGFGDFGASWEQAMPDGDNEAEFTRLPFGPEEGDAEGAAVNSPVAGRLPAGIGGGAPKPGAGAPGKLEFTTADILDPKDRLELENRSASVESNQRIIEHHNENLAYQLAKLDDLKNRKNEQEIEEEKARATQHTEYVTGKLRKKIVKEEKVMEEIRARANLDAAELSPRDTPRVEDAREATDDARRRRTARSPLRSDGEDAPDGGRPSTWQHPLGRMAQPDYEIQQEISKRRQELTKAGKELVDLRRQGSSVPGYVLNGAIGKTADLGREIGKLEKEAETVRGEDAGKRQMAGRNAPIFIPMTGGKVDTRRLAEGRLYKTRDGTLFVWDGAQFREARRLEAPDEEGFTYMPRSDPADRRVAGHPGAVVTPRELVDAAEAIQRENNGFGAQAGRIKVLAIKLAGVQDRLRYYRLNGIPESDYRVKAARQRLKDGMPQLRRMYDDLEKAAKPEVVSLDEVPQLGVNRLVKRWNLEFGSRIPQMDEQRRRETEPSRRELAKLENEVARLDEFDVVGRLSPEQRFKRDSWSKRAVELRRDIKNSDSAYAEKRAGEKEYFERWNQLAKTAIETYPVDPKSNEVIAGGFAGLVREFFNAGDLEDLAGDKATLDHIREGRNNSLGLPRLNGDHPGLRDETWEEGLRNDRIGMQEQLVAETEGEIRLNINTIAESLVKQGQLPRTATGWLAEQAVKSDDLGKFLEFLVTDPESVIVHFAATYGLRELSGWLAGLAAGAVAGAVTRTVAMSVEMAAAVNGAVDIATGMLAAMAFAENEAMIDMLQADNVSLKDKEAVASYIDENLDEVVKEINSAELDAVQEEFMESLLKFKTE